MQHTMPNAYNKNTFIQNTSNTNIFIQQENTTGLCNTEHTTRII